MIDYQKLFSTLKTNFINNSYCYFLSLLFSFVFIFYGIINTELVGNLIELQARNFDAYFFQSRINQAHYYLANLEIYALFSELSWYAYGWIFWLPISLITFPFYVLELHQLVIIIPLQMGVVFSILSLIVLSKIIGLFTSNKIINGTAIAIIIITPTFTYININLYTYPYFVFFTLLSLYYALILPENFSLHDTKKLLICLALGTGIKLSFVIILALIGLLMVSRLQWRINKQNINMGCIFLISYGCLALLAYNPAIYYFPKLAFVREIVRISNFTSTSFFTSDYTPFNHFTATIEQWYVSGLLLALLMLFFIIVIATTRQNRKKTDLAIILLVITSNVIFNVMTVRVGASNLATYSINLYYLLLLGLLLLDHRYIKRYSHIVAISIFMLCLVSVYQQKYHQPFKENQHLSYYQRFLHTFININPVELEQRIIKAKALNTDLKYLFNEAQNYHILREHTVLTFYNFDKIHHNISDTAFFHDLTGRKKQITQGAYDYIFLSKNSDLFLSAEDFANKYAQRPADYHQKGIASIAYIKEELLTDKNFERAFNIGNHQYEIIDDNRHVLIIKKLN